MSEMPTIRPCGFALHRRESIGDLAHKGGVTSEWLTINPERKKGSILRLNEVLDLFSLVRGRGVCAQ
jgi:hypothetical protein